MFFDDTVRIYPGPNFDALVGHVNNSLDNITDLCKNNKLSFNSHKCKYMLFTYRYTPLRPTNSIKNTPRQKDSEFYIKDCNSIQILNIMLMLINCEEDYLVCVELNLKSAEQVYFSCA